MSEKSIQLTWALSGTRNQVTKVTLRKGGPWTVFSSKHMNWNLPAIRYWGNWRPAPPCLHLSHIPPCHFLLFSQYQQSSILYSTFRFLLAHNFCFLIISSFHNLNYPILSFLVHILQRGKSCWVLISFSTKSHHRSSSLQSGMSGPNSVAGWWWLPLLQSLWAWASQTL